MASRPRGFETLRDMVLSMAVVGAVVLAIFLVVVWQRPEVQGDIRPSVDVAGLVDQVNVTAPFPVEQPQDLPAGWTPNSAWFEGPDDWPGLRGSVLHLGYVTPSGSYAEVKQTDGRRAFSVQEWTDAGVAAGSADIRGRSWERLEAPDSGKLALVLTASGGAGAPTVLVTGKADWSELEVLAASLEPAN